MLFDESAVLIVHLPSTKFGHIPSIMLISCCSVRCASVFPILQKCKGQEGLGGSLHPVHFTVFLIDTRWIYLFSFLLSS
jgi:hypothetical protein